MKKLLLSVALFLSMGIAHSFAGGVETHLSGYIDDSMCAGSGKPMHGGDRETCAQKCMKMGAKAVLQALVDDGTRASKLLRHRLQRIILRRHSCGADD